MTKVCHLSSAHAPNDTRIFHKQCASLAKAGYQVSFVVKAKDAQSVGCTTQKGVQVIQVPVDSSSRLKRMLFGAKAVYQKALEVDADIYEFHDPELLPYGLKLAKKGKKVIFDSHEDYPTQIMEKEWIPTLLRRIISSAYRAYETHVVKQLDAVLFPCTKNGINIFENRAKQVVILSNAVMLEEMTPPQQEAQKSGDTICCTGSLTYQRGITHLIRAAHQAGVKLILAGQYSSEEYRRELEAMPEVDTVTSLATTEAEEKDGETLHLGDKMTPRELAEFADIDIELVDLLYTAYAVDQKEYGHIVGGIDHYGVPLIDMFEFIYDEIQDGAVSLDAEQQKDLDDLYDELTDGKDQLNSGKYSRLVMDLNVSQESEETFAFLDKARQTAQNYYGDDVLLVGNATSNFDLSATFGEDNTLISILSIVFVMIVLLLTFQSAVVPFILILVIQGSVWMNFTYPTLRGTPIFFMSYLVVSSIQMGANIDYAIVITNRYMELRQKMPKIEAMKQSLNLAFPTIFTSGSILAAAGTAIGFLSSDGAISGIGICLGRGTLLSILLVMGILPQLLLLGDFIIDKTSFKKPEKKEKKANEEENEEKKENVPIGKEAVEGA